MTGAGPAKAFSTLVKSMQQLQNKVGTNVTMGRA